MLRTNLTTRRTYVRLRASKNKTEVLFLFDLSVLHLFFLSPKKRLKKLNVFDTLFSFCRFLSILTNYVVYC